MMTDEKNALVIENLKIAYFFANKYRNLSELDVSIQFEDVKQVALCGLCKAAAVFDNERNVPFSTCAGVVIENELRMFARQFQTQKNKANIYATSLDAPLADAENLALVDLLIGSDDIEKDFFYQIASNELQNRIRMELSTKERRALLLAAGGTTQTEIGRAIGVKQAYVSRLLKQSRKKLFSTKQMILEVV